MVDQTYYDWNTGCWNCQKLQYCNGFWKWSGEVEQLDFVKGRWRVVGTNGNFEIYELGKEKRYDR